MCHYFLSSTLGQTLRTSPTNNGEQILRRSSKSRKLIFVVIHFHRILINFGSRIVPLVSSTLRSIGIFLTKLADFGG